MNVISVHGAPRSGTSWLGAIFDSCPTVRYKRQPLFSWSFKNWLQPSHDKYIVQDFCDRLWSSTDRFINEVDDKRIGIHPVFDKDIQNTLAMKHVRHHQLLPLFTGDCSDFMKVVGIVRDPRSVISSWARAPKEFSQDWDLNKEWLDAPSKNTDPYEWNGFNKWKQLASMFLALESDNFKLIRYEDLVLNTKQTVADLFYFAGIPLTKQTTDFIDQSQSKTIDNAYGVYRKNQSLAKWKHQLDLQIAKEIESLTIEAGLERFLYET